MSIENSLERIAKALEALVGCQTMYPTDYVPKETPASQPAPVAAPIPSAPPAAPVQSSAPFADAAGLVKYVTETYQALGPEKGMEIQGVLQSFGLSNVTDLPVDKYGEFHTKVEALKS